MFVEPARRQVSLSKKKRSMTGSQEVQHESRLEAKKIFILEPWRVLTFGWKKRKKMAKNFGDGSVDECQRSVPFCRIQYAEQRWLHENRWNCHRSSWFSAPWTGQKAWKRFTKPKTGTCIPQSRSLPQSPLNFQWIDWSTPVPGWSERLRNSCSDHSCKAPQETVGTRRKRLEDEAKALL